MLTLTFNPVMLENGKTWSDENIIVRFGKGTECRVLEVKDGMAHLLVAYPTIRRELGKKEFKGSPLEQYLNTRFVNDYFTDFERAMIVDRPEGMITLLTTEQTQCEKYFPTTEDLIVRKGENEVSWWLSDSDSENPKNKNFIYTEGGYDILNAPFYTTIRYVRPDFWVKLDGE